MAEQIASRWRWLVCYFGAGIVGELVAYSWQPVGAGNSVAVCGLAGLIALACWRRDARLPAFGSFALLLWCAVILSTWDWPAAVAGAVCAAAELRLQAGGWRYAGEFAVAVTVASGVFLACVGTFTGRRCWPGWRWRWWFAGWDASRCGSGRRNRPAPRPSI